MVAPCLEHGIPMLAFEFNINLLLLIILFHYSGENFHAAQSRAYAEPALQNFKPKRLATQGLVLNVKYHAVIFSMNNKFKFMFLNGLYN